MDDVTASVAAEARMRLRSGRAISMRRMRTSLFNDDPSDDPSPPVSADSTESPGEAESVDDDEASRAREEPSSSWRALFLSSAPECGSEDDRCLLAHAARQAVHLVAASGACGSILVDAPFEPR